MRDLRGREMSMIFQNPRAALNPDPQGRPPDRGRAAPARAGGLRRRHRQGRRHPRAGADRAGQGALPRLSLRAVGRHVPARGHRLGAGLPAAAADRRRADHGARRHHAEDGDGPRRRAHARAGHVDHSHHPRPGAGGRLLRSRGGDGEGTCGGDRGVKDHLHGALPPLHPQADARDAAPGRQPARSAAGGGSCPPSGCARRRS